jgi:hypothetical protein
LKSRLDGHGLDQKWFVINRRLYNAVEQLSSPEIIRMHTDDVNDFHCQPHLFHTKPLRPEDVSTETSYSFSRELNVTHKLLHDNFQHRWFEAAHVTGHAECLMHIARPAKGFEGQPVLTFVNGANDPVVTEGNQNFVDMFNKAYEQSCKTKNEPLIQPRAVILLGQFSDDQRKSMLDHYGVVYVNGVKVIDFNKNTQDISSAGTGTYGYNAAGYTPS